MSIYCIPQSWHHWNGKTWYTTGHSLFDHMICKMAEPKPKRARTLKDKIQNHLEKYPLLIPCNDSCWYKCKQHFHDDYRQDINNQYWSLDFTARQSWLDSHIRIEKVKRRYVRSENPRKLNSMVYQLPLLNGEKQRVCKLMLIHTLWMKSNGPLQWFKKRKVREIK